jgi:hypothetical protein
MQPWSVPEVLRPLYESSTLLAQKTTMAVRLFCIEDLVSYVLILHFSMKTYFAMILA